jgi:hypothetical protein
MTLTFTGSVWSGQAVTPAMFGGNNMFKYNLIDAQGASFDAAAKALGVTGIRYPGGTMTEQDFDVTRPNAAPASWTSGQPFVGVTEFLTYAARTGTGATIVLPTAKMFSGSASGGHDVPRAIDQNYLTDVRDYVELMLTLGDSGPGALPDTPITAFEIGNEYWGSGGMTATEYGRVVNALGAELYDLFRDHFADPADRPQVLIQMGDPWGAQFSTGIYSSLTWDQRGQQSNQNIIDQLTTPQAVSVVTGLVQHYYYSPTDTTFLQGSRLVNYIDQDWKVWADAGFGDRDLSITEWNVKFENTAQFGLKGASVLIEQMEQMIQMGVDSAFAWPVQGWNTGLAGDFNAAPVLSPAGAAFAMMAKGLVGLSVLDSNISGGQLEVNAFASATQTLLFVSSRSDQGQHVSLDVSSLVSGYSSIAGVKIGIAAGLSTMDPGAAAVLTTYRAANLMKLGLLDFDLAPFEVMQISFVLPKGVLVRGGASSEKLQGGSGADTMMGNGGNDTIIGGQGHDTISGGLGNDMLSGWAGNDIAYGESGSDRLFGEAGFDRLFGGIGNDTLQGGDDDDYLDGGWGRDLLVGGRGEDSFIFSSALSAGAGFDTITDMQGGVDHIIVDNDVFVGLWAGALREAAFRVSAVSSAVSWADRIIYNSSTGQLFFDQDGRGATYSGVQFAQLKAGLALTYEDFTVI